MRVLKEPNSTYNNQNRKIAFRKADLLKKKECANQIILELYQKNFNLQRMLLVAVMREL